MAKLRIRDGKVEDYTLVLSTRDYRHLGQITGIDDSMDKSDNLASANEISFTVYKHDFINTHNTINSMYSDEEYESYIASKEKLWNQIVDFRLIWVKETNEYFEIYVSTDESTENESKTVTGTSLCEAELSQLYIDSLEVNSENDIARDDYVVTTFYNAKDPSASLLDRALADKAQHYTIMHVDDSLTNIQRTFSVSGTSIYDFFTGDIADEFNCLFVFDSAERGIYVYDLYTVCEDCGYRGDYYDECPECGSTNLNYFGEDTTIYVDKDNLTDSISLETNADDIKNCLKLEAGDDLMTATVRLLNQNGSNYLYYISDFQREDMPEELVTKLDAYQELYDSYTDEYQELVSQYYDLTDEILYLESGMMPTIENAEVTASTEAEKLTETNLSPLGLSSVTTATSTATVNSAIKNYAKVYAKTGYVKLEIVDGSSFEYEGTDSDGWNYGYWYGQIQVTNYSDEDDVVTTDYMTIKVYDNYEEFIQQKMLKALNEANDDSDSSVFDVLAIDNLEEFKNALTLYCLSRLTSFYDAIQAALDVLIQVDQASESADLYESLYLPYYNKLQACQAELDKRQAEVDETQATLDETYSRITEIQSILNFQNYLGEEYFNIYCAYRREDTYSNTNYISDGLDNAELINRAKEFLEAAQKELEKAAEPQYSISSTLYNLLLLDEFKPIVNKFELGNWVRVKIDNKLYRLRLIGYEINFGNIQELDVEFSSVTKIKDCAFDAKQIIDSVKSMTTSFSYVQKQAEQGDSANTSIESWVKNGLDITNLSIISSADNQEMTWTTNGLLFREYSDITESYEDTQLKIINSTIAITDNKWETVKTAIGKFYYTDPETEETVLAYGINAETLVGKLILGEQLGIYTSASDGSSASMTFDINGLNITNGTNTFTVNPNSSTLLTLSNDSGNILYVDEDGTLYVTATLKAGNISGWTIGETAIYNGTTSLEDTTPGTYIGTDGITQRSSSGDRFILEDGLITSSSINTQVIGLTESFGNTAETILSFDALDMPLGFCMSWDGVAYIQSSTSGRFTIGSKLSGYETHIQGEKTYITGGNIYIDNDARIYGYDSGQTARTMCYLSSDDNFYFGAGELEGNVYIGNSTYTSGVYIRSSDRTAIVGSSYIHMRPNSNLSKSNTGIIFHAYATTDAPSTSSSSNSLLVAGMGSEGGYIRSYATYDRKSSSSANLHISESGVFSCYESSASRYKNTINYFTNTEYASEEGLAKRDYTVAEFDYCNDYKAILKFPVVQFHYNSGYMTGEPDYDYNKYVTGFVAEDIAKICPACATYNEDGTIEAWNHMEIIPRMVACIQELNNRVIELEERITELETK